VPTILVRCILFLCSYAPLTLIVCVLQYGVWPLWVLALLAGVVGIGSMLGTLLYLGWMRRGNSVYERKVERFDSHDEDVMTYIATYIIPFVTFPLAAPKQVIALVFFLLVLLVIYVRSNMIYVNPILSLSGYHLYEIEIEHVASKRYYIARKPLERGHNIRFVLLSDDIFLESVR
jgi:hypothetical protein